jgi:hypothetical protein
MYLTPRRKKIKSKLLAESSGLQFAINRQNDHIEYLYKKIIEKKILIPKLEKSEIIDIEESIVKNEMDTFRITIRFQDQIIQILEKLLGMVSTPDSSEEIAIIDSMDGLPITKNSV